MGKTWGEKYWKNTVSAPVFFIFPQYRAETVFFPLPYIGEKNGGKNTVSALNLIALAVSEFQVVHCVWAYICDMKKIGKEKKWSRKCTVSALDLNEFTVLELPVVHCE